MVYDTVVKEKRTEKEKRRTALEPSVRVSNGRRTRVASFPRIFPVYVSIRSMILTAPFPASHFSLGSE